MLQNHSRALSSAVERLSYTEDFPSVRTTSRVFGSAVEHELDTLGVARLLGLTVPPSLLSIVGASPRYRAS
jgi:hypothetical protein